MLEIPFRYPVIYELPENKSLADVLGNNLKGVSVLCFHANWCMPCRSIKPALELVLKKRNRLDSEVNPRMIRINIDYHMDLAKKYHVSSVPCVVLIKDGRAIQYLKTTDNVEKNFNNMLDIAEEFGFQ